MKAIQSWLGPIHAPTPAASFKSPIPMPRRKQGNPNSRSARPNPAKLVRSPVHPPAIAGTIMPDTRNGTDSQFGMRRVRRSIPDAITSTTRLAHHAMEFIECLRQGHGTEGLDPLRAGPPIDYDMLLTSLLAILLKASLMPPATVPMPATAAKAISAATNAYSIKSWPQSSRRIWALMYVFRSKTFILISVVFEIR